MSAKPDTRHRARIALLSHIMEFSLLRRIGTHVYNGLDDMAFAENRNPPVGALVAINSAPSTKWYLSWVREVAQPEGRYALESIEDGQICDWSNCTLLQYDQRQTDSHPEWRWTDRQWAFSDRWYRTLKRERDAYIYLGTWPTFEGDDVRLGVRVRFGLDPTLPGRAFTNWRKLTKKMMLDFYDEQVAAYKAIKHEPGGGAPQGGA